MSAKGLLVTGASRGIGRACALLAGRNGWAVGVNYREDAKAADAVVEAIAKSDGRAVALKGDIAVEADVIGMFDAATKALGPLTAVIANAGVVAPTAKLAEMNVERMRRVFGCNALGSGQSRAKFRSEACRRLSAGPCSPLGWSAVMRLRWRPMTGGAALAPERIAPSRRPLAAF